MTNETTAKRQLLMNPLTENRLIAIALVFGLGFFAALFAAGFWLTDGVFVYPLDDTYIHLSMAEQIAAGGYGINPNEYASADSSILYPVLLTPFSGTALHVYMPLILNVAALAIALVLLAKIIVESGLVAARGFSLALIIIAPVALNFQGLALLGMEHMLHVDTVLMALLGLMRWQKTGRLNGLLIAAILLGPLLRFEGLGLALLLSAVVFWRGHKKWGAGLALGALLPMVSFGFWLKSLGLSFLPNSVLAKSEIIGEDDSAIWAVLGFNFGPNGTPLFALMFIAVGLAFLLAAVVPRINLAPKHKVLALVTAGMVLGHAFLGKFGWANRYEIYALTFMVMAALVVLAPVIAGKGRPALYAKAASLGAMAFGVAHYIGFATVWAMHGPANIYNQQWQMAEIARGFEGGAVMVNDIGLVSYQNEVKIIDLYGLASMEALKARREQAPRGWPNRMAIDENAGMAMGYDSWFKVSLAPGWIAIAYLDLNVPSTFLSPRVTIYATRNDMVAPITELLKNYEPRLPRFASFEFVDTSAAPQPEDTR